MSSQAAFSDRLKILMNDQRVTITGLSIKTGIPERTIARYRGGQSEPRDSFGDPTPNAHAIAQALGVDTGELLDTQPEALAS